jgi:hypothetical protein
MEVLRTEWLRPLIEKVLNNWLEHPGTEISGVSRSEKIQKPIDHESTLRIRVEPIARCAQLLEVSPDTPYCCCLSALKPLSNAPDLLFLVGEGVTAQRHNIRLLQQNHRHFPPRRCARLRET